MAIKNVVDAIANSGDLPNTNAALRVHRVYLMAMLTDIYGDIPCMDAGKGYTEGIATPKYDTQEEIYNWFHDEAASDSVTEALRELGSDYEEREIRRVRIKFLCEVAN